MSLESSALSNKSDSSLGQAKSMGISSEVRRSANSSTVGSRTGEGGEREFNAWKAEKEAGMWRSGVDVSFLESIAEKSRVYAMKVLVRKGWSLVTATPSPCVAK